MEKIERKMAELEPGSLRYQVLAGARDFKASWIGLGQILYTVYKDKYFKEWGYTTFEAYCKGEVGIQQQTASKLLHSYYFLERQEPDFLRAVHQDKDGVEPRNIPSVEAVNVLRLAAQNKELTEDDYRELKKSVFEEGREGKEVKKQVGLRLRSLREEEDPQKARAQRRQQTLRRLLGTLRNLQKEAVYGHLVSEGTAQELEKLCVSLDRELTEALDARA
ncbi:MAG: hypothetical protein ACM3L6_01120 [Deltaproteobacteria bacterium]